MKNSELIKQLSKHPNQEVIVKIENWLYYPIKQIVTSKDGNIIIVCRNIQEFEKGIDQK